MAPSFHSDAAQEAPCTVHETRRPDEIVPCPLYPGSPVIARCRAVSSGHNEPTGDLRPGMPRADTDPDSPLATDGRRIRGLRGHDRHLYASESPLLDGNGGGGRILPSVRTSERVRRSPSVTARPDGVPSSFMPTRERNSAFDDPAGRWQTRPASGLRGVSSPGFIVLHKVRLDVSHEPFELHIAVSHRRHPLGCSDSTALSRAPSYPIAPPSQASVEMDRGAIDAHCLHSTAHWSSSLTPLRAHHAKTPGDCMGNPPGARVVTVPPKP